MAQHGLSTQPNRDGAPAVHVGPPNDGIQEMFESLARRAFEIFESNGHGLGHDLENWAQAERELFHPAHLEISETDGKFAVRAEVPGFSAKELEISIDGRRLTISGKREKREERKDKKRIYSEYCSDQVLRAVDLPAEKEQPRGIFVLCEGQIKLSISSSEGKTLILKIARPGEALGLMAVVGGTPYQFTAETLRPSQVAFVRSEDFLRFLKNHREVYKNVVEQFVSSYEGVCNQLRTVGLSSAPTRLARVLLDWSDRTGRERNGSRITMPLTHEEIAECIGSTRETVTRILTRFKDRRWITTRGASMTIHDRKALEAIAVA